MPKVTLMCGRICSGKSTYAQKLRRENRAVLLSVDEIMLTLFGQHTGDRHDEYVEKLESYLFAKSLEIVETGTNVVFDIGLWTRSERDCAREFYRSHNVEYELVYIDVDDGEWRRRIEKRNRAVLAGETDAYYVDDGLAAKFAGMFEKPGPDEPDINFIKWRNGNE